MAAPVLTMATRKKYASNFNAPKKAEATGETQIFTDNSIGVSSVIQAFHFFAAREDFGQKKTHAKTQRRKDNKQWSGRRLVLCAFATLRETFLSSLGSGYVWLGFIAVSSVASSFAPLEEPVSNSAG